MHHETDCIALKGAYVALLLLNMPPVMFTNAVLPRVEITPPDSRALLFLNIPPSIVMVDGPDLPSQNIYCRNLETDFGQGRGSDTRTLQRLGW